MFPTLLTTLALVASSLSFAGQILYSNITNSSLFVNGSYLTTGHHFILPDSSTTTAPATYLRDETTPIHQWPTDPGTEFCTGNTGALLCQITIKLTGSGGHRNSNAGSYTCTTSTCSIIETILLVESGSDLIYGGWNNTPTTQSGVQLYNRKRVKNGISLTGSSALVRAGYDGATVTTVSKDVPPGSTIKFQWEDGNGTEDFARTRAAVVLRFFKFYNP